MCAKELHGVQAQISSGADQITTVEGGQAQIPSGADQITTVQGGQAQIPSRAEPEWDAGVVCSVDGRRPLTAARRALR